MMTKNPRYMKSIEVVGAIHKYLVCSEGKYALSFYKSYKQYIDVLRINVSQLICDLQFSTMHSRVYNLVTSTPPTLKFQQ